METTLTHSTLHPREIEIRAVEAMEAEVAENGAGIPPLIIAQTPDARAVLGHVAKLVVHDVPPSLAMTDPSRYRKLARLRVELILRGYHDHLARFMETGPCR